MKFLTTFLLTFAACFSFTLEPARGQDITLEDLEEEFAGRNMIEDLKVRLTLDQERSRLRGSIIYELQANTFFIDGNLDNSAVYELWRELPVDRDGDGSLDTELFSSTTINGRHFDFSARRLDVFTSRNFAEGQVPPGRYILRGTVTYQFAFTQRANSAPVVVPISLGDLNLDGGVNFLDIPPFIAILTAGGFRTEADINGDGAVNFMDISPFIALLSS